MGTIREELTSEQRSKNIIMRIGPGFVHRRKIIALLEVGEEYINKEITELPSMPDWERQVRIDHIYSKYMLHFCSHSGVKTLSELLSDGCGTIFCSTEKVEGCSNFLETERACNKWVPTGEYDYSVEFHYSTSLVVSDTLKCRLQEGDTISIIAQLSKKEGRKLIFDPIIMGFPLLYQDKDLNFDVSWFGYDYFENFIEDFDEFKLVKNYSGTLKAEEMKNITEAAFKTCLGKILNEEPKKDWGGETSDLYTAHLHLNGQRVSAAFLLKGPANFAPMTLNHLGKNNDQIVRLSHEPAQVLFVQHSHEILQPVRETLRAFAVQPSNPRRYCLIDGNDSLKLLKAYGLFEEALKLSNKDIK